MYDSLRPGRLRTGGAKLFRHALAETSGNYLAEHNLRNYLMDIPGRLPEAIAIWKPRCA